MKLIGNIFLLPIKLIMFLLLILLFCFNIIVSILSGLSNVFLNIFTTIFGFLFIYQLITRPYTTLDFIGVLILFLFLGLIRIIISFFPTTLGMINRQINRGLAFWF